MPKSQRTASTVEILNPAPNGARYTSRKRADEMVSTGRAQYTHDRRAIVLRAIDSEAERKFRRKQLLAKQEREIDRMRGGIFSKRGCRLDTKRVFHPTADTLLPHPGSPEARGYIEVDRTLQNCLNGQHSRECPDGCAVRPTLPVAKVA